VLNPCLAKELTAEQAKTLTVEQAKQPSLK
jgi:hypothetical protein